MIRIKGRGAVYGEVWYDERVPVDPDVDIVVLRARSEPIGDCHSWLHQSLVTLLSAGTDAIAGGFDTTCRRHIRRAQRSDGLEATFYDEPESKLAEFAAFFDVFARQKSVAPCDRTWLAAACNARQLALTRVSAGDETLVWHAYIVAGTTVGLMYSGSWFRDAKPEDRTRLARANRWLHWQDILYFKERGLGRYDWGGVFADEATAERAGINRFKNSFGPAPQPLHDRSRPITLRGRLWLPLREARQAWRLRRASAADRRSAASGSMS